MIKDPKIKNIIREQCKETGIDISDGEEIWLSIIRFIKQTFKEGNYMDGPESFKNIYIKGLGSFHSMPKRIFKVAEGVKNKKKENELAE